MKKVELLAPAGSFEGLKSAIAFGADAIYMGGKSHNARIGALNFDEKELEQAIKYARLRDKRVYITFNTVLFEKEMDGVIKYANELQDMGANALILQDLGVAKLIAENCTIPMHASTQMGIHSLSCCNAIESMGFERAILSRETPLSQIEYIHKNSKMELEAFIHGALCSCFSGQCYYSFVKGGRSGNRGECAQPCRLQYGGGYPLSTKDLMALELLPTLIKAGVCSFKIEGRMKRPAYAGVVTDIYRKAVDLCLENADIPIEKFREQLIKIYNRGGFTKGYYLDNKDIYGVKRPNHIGERVGRIVAVGKNKVTIDTDKEIHIFDGLSFGNSGMEISDLYKDGERIEKGSGRLTFSCVLKEISKGAEVFRTTDYLQIKNVEQQVLGDNLQIPLNISCEIDKNIVLTLTAKDKTVTVTGGGVETAKTRALTADDVLKSLSKLGDTSFMLNDAKINVKDGVFVSVKDLNEARRKGVYLLEQALIKGEEREKVVFPTVETAKETEDIKIVIGIWQRQRPKDCDVFLVYPKNIEGALDADGIVFPGVSFDDDLEKIEKAIKPDMIVVCNNIGQIERLRGKCRIWAGFGLNCTNSECFKALKGLGCERAFASIEAEAKGAYAFKEGLMPVMTFVACPQKAAVGCEDCKGKSAVSNARFTCVDLEHRYSFMLKEHKGKKGQIVII